MPLYEYRCEACKIKFDLFRRFADADAPATCPRCGGQETKRALARFSTPGGGGGEGASSASGGSCSGCSSHNCSHCGH
ncbi:MAG: zinc ribbon domain-containing protein [Chloroflexi bacterium]|nr:zinc ribbon domain-containing protein [Chloroflexota bacterium]